MDLFEISRHRITARFNKHIMVRIIHDIHDTDHDLNESHNATNQTLSLLLCVFSNASFDSILAVVRV